MFLPDEIMLLLNRWLPGGQFATFVFYSTWLYSLIQKCLTWRHNKKENKVFVHYTIKQDSLLFKVPSISQHEASLIVWANTKSASFDWRKQSAFWGERENTGQAFEAMPTLSVVPSFFLSFLLSLSFFLSFILSLTQQHRQRWDSTSFDKLKSYSRLKLKTNTV